VKCNNSQIFFADPYLVIGEGKILKLEGASEMRVLTGR